MNFIAIFILLILLKIITSLNMIVSYYWQHFIMKAMIKNLAYFIHTLLEIYIEATSKYNFHHTTSFFNTGNKIFISIK